VAIVLALITALAFGTGDFLGGLVSRRVPPLAVAFVSQVVAGGALLAAAWVLGPGPSGAVLAWGAAAGVANGAAFVIYLRGLAAGSMGVVSTLTAVWSALVPFAAGLLQGERPGTWALLGAAAVLLGALLVSAGPQGPLRRGEGHRRRRRGAGSRSRPAWTLFAQPGVFEGTLSGVLYGAGAVLYQRAGPHAALWPALAAVVATAVLTGALAWFTRTTIVPAVCGWRLVGGMGLLHALASAAFVLAIQSGLLSIVAVVAAMGPIPTTLLARLVLGETLRPAQSLGVVLGLAGIAFLLQP